MDKTKKYLAFSFVMVLVAVTIVSVIGMILLDRKPVVLQGQIEATIPLDDDVVPNLYAPLIDFVIERAGLN